MAQVGTARVGVADRRVSMPMDVRLARPVRVLVVRVAPTAMLVLERLVLVLARMLLREMQPHPSPGGPPSPSRRDSGSR